MKSIMLLFSIVLISAISCSQQKVKVAEPDPMVKSIEMVYHVEGMTCNDCEMSVQKGVGELKGITTVQANYLDSTTRVVYDPSKTNDMEIIAAIEKRGYTVVIN